jgi:hypothetical protein
MKLHYPHPGWGEARWDAHEDVHVDVALAVRALAELPGVRYYVGPEWTSLEVPRNAWSTREWSLLTSTDWPPAVAARLQSVEYPSARKAAARAFVETHLWAPKQPLYAHQTEAARFLVANQGGLCADQMGLGKTRTAIVAAQSLAADFGSERPRVVIAPGYTRDVWRRELLATGAIKKPEQMSAAFTRDPTGEDFDWDAPWWFIHYDIAWWWRGYMALRRRPVVAILDEIHWIKNGRAQRSKGAAAIAGAASARIGLTGTPISNRPAELWWPLTVIDGSGTWGSPKDFRERYCGAVHDGYGLHDTGPTNVDELGIRLSDRYIRRTIDSAGVTRGDHARLGGEGHARAHHPAPQAGGARQARRDREARGRRARGRRERRRLHLAEEDRRQHRHRRLSGGREAPRKVAVSFVAPLPRRAAFRVRRLDGPRRLCAGGT